MGIKDANSKEFSIVFPEAIAIQNLDIPNV
jgi:hypothetical protein